MQRKLVKATREKPQITYKGNDLRLSVYFLAETLKARNQWQDVFKVMKEKKLQPRILYPSRLSFRFDEEIKSYIIGKQKIKEFNITKLQYNNC